MNELIVDTIGLHSFASEIANTTNQRDDSEDLAVPGQKSRNTFTINSS